MLDTQTNTTGAETPFSARDHLNAALLQMATGLVESPDCAAVLQRLCDALVAASSNIRLAWVWRGPADTQSITPQVMAGPAREYAESLRIDRTWFTAKGPVYQTLMGEDVAWMRVTRLSLFGPWRRAASRHGFGEAIALRLDGLADDQVGVVVFYADRPDYFEDIGLSPFHAFVAVAKAMLRQSQTVQTLRELAVKDQLTGLLNRRGMQEALSKALARAKRSGEPFGLILMDLDRFKLLNDSYGHPAGDATLVHVATVLRSTLREEDAIARWGGEEFLMVLAQQDLQASALVAERLRHNIAATPLTVGRRSISLSASLGVTAWSSSEDTAEQLIAEMDSLLYDAKRNGRNTIKSKLDTQSHTISLGSQLQTALTEDRICVAYQPLVDLHDARIVGHEALARMVTPDGQIVSAQSFIGAAHHMRLEHRIDTAVIGQVVRHCAAANAVSTLQGTRHLVNCSADFLGRAECVQGLLEMVRAIRPDCRNRAGPRPLIIEITERQILKDPHETLKLLQPLLDFGIELAVDDFGSGYSSFLYLLDLPVRYLKIEMQLVQRAMLDPKARIMVRSIQSMARELGILTIAEGIETEAQRDLMREIGIDWGQGYLWGKPETNKRP
jgi:diguanylate cyclase (GGDEF)-like protein